MFYEGEHKMGNDWEKTQYKKQHPHIIKKKLLNFSNIGQLHSFEQ